LLAWAIADLASSRRADSRTRRLRLLQKVLDLVRKVHAAQTLEAIEHLHIEADNLVIAIIHLTDHEEFEDSVRLWFSFPLDQLRFAIAARRTAILDREETGMLGHEQTAPEAAASTGAGGTKAAAA